MHMHPIPLTVCGIAEISTVLTVYKYSVMPLSIGLSYLYSAGCKKLLSQTRSTEIYHAMQINILINTIYQFIPGTRNLVINFRHLPKPFELFSTRSDICSNWILNFA